MFVLGGKQGQSVLGEGGMYDFQRPVAMDFDQVLVFVVERCSILDDARCEGEGDGPGCQCHDATGDQPPLMT